MTARACASTGTPTASPAPARRASAAFGVEVIDLYYAHRLDPNVPVEDTVGAMARLVEQGKVRAIGLSEVTAPRASPGPFRSPHNGAAVRIFCSGSVASRRKRCLPAGSSASPSCRFSPLGRSMLTGAVGADTRFSKGDFRITDPRFSAENLATNLAPVEALARLAASKHCRPGQLALAGSWHSPSTSCRSPAPSTSNMCVKIWSRPIRPSAATRSAFLSALFAPDRIAGERYAPNDPGRRADKG